jgi:uncharacterized protein YoxC
VDTVLTVAEVVALVCLSALCVYLIVALTTFKKEVSEFSQRAKPVLDNLAYITDKLKSAAGKIDDQVDIVKGSLYSFKSVADNILLFEERVQRQLEQPIFQVASVIGAIVTSIAAFFDRFRTRPE